MTSAIQFDKASFLSWLVKGDSDEDQARPDEDSISLWTASQGKDR